MGNAGTGGQMVTPPDETTADPYAVIAALRAERDALAEALTQRRDDGVWVCYYLIWWRDHLPPGAGDCPCRH